MISFLIVSFLAFSINVSYSYIFVFHSITDYYENGEWHLLQNAPHSEEESNDDDSNDSMPDLEGEDEEDDDMPDID